VGRDNSRTGRDRTGKSAILTGWRMVFPASVDFGGLKRDDMAVFA